MLYLARRMLKFSVEEWEDLPWWQQKLYMNGVQWEFERGGIHPHPLAGGGGDGAGSDPFTPLDGMGARAALGITVL